MSHPFVRLSMFGLFIIFVGISTIMTARADAQNLFVDSVKLENQLKTDLENEVIRNLNTVIQSGNILKEQAFTQLKSQAYSKVQKQILDAVNQNPELKKIFESKKESARTFYKEIIKTEPYGGYIKSAVSEYKTGQSKEIIQKLTNKLSSAKNQVAQIVKKSNGITEAMEAPDADYAAILKKYGIGGKWIKTFETQEKKLRKISSILDSNYGDYWSMFKMIHEGMEGNQPDKKIETLFKLMEGFGSKIPILGDFVQLYGETALAMLEATNKLKQTMSKFDEGCVGQGSHLTFSGNPQNSFMDTYPGERACPDGGIKDLYFYEGVELNQNGKLYFWTGTKWIHTERGTGGIKTLKKILTLLAKTEAKYGNHIVQSDIQTAFKFYDIDFPGGFNAIYEKAKSTLKQIDERAKKLETFFVHQGGGSPQIFKDFMATETTYKKKPIEDYLYQKFDLFAVRYIKGFMEDENGAYLKHNDMLTYIDEMKFCIVWGHVKSPAKKIDDLHISIKETPNITVLDEITDGSKKEYTIIMSIHPGAMLSYKLQSNDVESKLIKHKPLATNKMVRVDVELGLELSVTLEFPKSINANEKTRLVTTIEGGEPPYDLVFSTSEKKIYDRPDQGHNYAAKLKFKDSGPQWIDVIATDKNMLTGQARIDFEVKDNLGVSLSSKTPEAIIGSEIQVDARINGGVPPYYLSWTLSNGKSLAVTKNETDPSITATYANPGKHWVNLSVKDSSSNTPLTAAAKINLIVLPEEFGIKLKQITKNITPGQTMVFHLFIAGGEPPYTISGDVSGSLRGHSGELSIQAPKEPGKYAVIVNVKDNLGKLVSAQHLITINSSLSIQLHTKTHTVKPNDKITVDINISGGEPPFKLSGIQSDVLETREGEFIYQAPEKLGEYSISISVSDKNNNLAKNSLLINVGSGTLEKSDSKDGLGIDWGDMFDQLGKQVAKDFKESGDNELPKPTFDPNELQELLGGPFPDDLDSEE